MRLAVRIPLLLGGSVMATGLAFAGWAHLTMLDLTATSVESDALRALSLAHRALEITGTPGQYGVLNDPRVPAPVLDAVAQGQRATYRIEDPPVIWAAEPAAAGVLAVEVSWAESLAQQRAMDGRLALGVAGLGGLTAATSLGLGWTLSRRLRAAELAAARIAAGDLEVRVTDLVRGGRDEVAALAATIDALAASMQERLASEKRVTADIAHDLRTPLTGLLTAAQLLGEGRPADLVRSQATRLWRLTEDLLEVARLDQAEQHLDLVDTTTGSLARSALAASDTSGVQLHVESDAAVRTDPRRVPRILVNLLANAQVHGRAPVVVSVRGATIGVADAGPGFPEDILTEGPRRFRTGASERGGGHGLGLTIALGQARAIGAGLTFTNAPGAEATLELSTTPNI